MVGFLARRTAAAIVILWLVASATFVLIEVTPGAPSALFQNPRIPPGSQKLLSSALDLDRPIGARYLRWLGAVVRGDWGTSFIYGQPVISVLGDRLPATVALGSAGLGVAVVVGTYLGLLGGRRPGSGVDMAVQGFAVASHSVPTFWLALMAVLVLATWVPVFPAGHFRSVDADSLGAGARVIDSLLHLILPATTLGFSLAGAVSRLLRAKVIALSNERFVATARAKGISERRLFFVHVLPLSLTSTIQILGLAFPIVCGGVLVIEVVFSWPGLGRTTYLAVQARDYPLVVGATTITAGAVVASSFLADVAEAAIDPRPRSRSIR